MSESSHIQWTDATWNPTTGCTKVSPGCAHCYIETTPPFRMEGRRFEKGHIPLRLHPDRLDKPLHWKKPRRVFVNSLSDLFHDDVPESFIAAVFNTMAQCPQHTFQVLTKRAERMQTILAGPKDHNLWHPSMWHGSVLPNVWIGVSAEDQKRADERIPLLLGTPAAVRFVSAEPLLGWISFPDVPGLNKCGTAGQEIIRNFWVIVGGESGPKARPCNIEWIRDIVAQCGIPGVPVFVKQLGSHTYRHDTSLPDGGRLRLNDRKGGDMEEWPEDLRVRQFPRIDTVSK